MKKIDRFLLYTNERTAGGREGVDFHCHFFFFFYFRHFHFVDDKAFRFCADGASVAARRRQESCFSPAPFSRGSRYYRNQSGKRGCVARSRSSKSRKVVIIIIIVFFVSFAFFPIPITRNLSSARPRAGLCCSSEQQRRRSQTTLTSRRRNRACQNSQRCVRERAFFLSFLFISRSARPRPSSSHPPPPSLPL